jgi:DNA-binding NarL/FixJ family response regulator
MTGYENDKNAIGVCVVAENRLLREALTRLLSKKDDLEVLGTLPFTCDLIGQIAACAPEVLLLDSIPRDLFDRGMVRDLCRMLPSVKVIVTGMESNKADFLRAVSEGVAGYLLKDASAGEVSAAVRAVLKGEAVCPPGLCMALFKNLRNQVAARTESGHRLTRRERELIGMIGQGLTNKEIASQLNLSEQTVKNHVHRMLRKVGASDRLSAVEICRGTLGHA